MDATFSLRKWFAIFIACLLPMFAEAQGTYMYQYPQTNAIANPDLILFSRWNGTTYNTRNITPSNFVASLNLGSGSGIPTNSGTGFSTTLYSPVLSNSVSVGNTYVAGQLVVNNAGSYLDVQGQSDAFAGSATAIRSSSSNIDNSLRLYNNGQSRYVAMFGLTENEYGEWAIGMGNKNTTYAYEYFLMSNPGPRNANTRTNDGFGMNVGIGIEGTYPALGDSGFNQHFAITITSNTLNTALRWGTNTDRHGPIALEVINSNRTVTIQNLVGTGATFVGQTYVAGPLTINNTSSSLTVQGQAESSIGMATTGVDNALALVNADTAKTVSVHGFTSDNYVEFILGIGNTNSAYTNEAIFVAQPGPPNVNTANGGFAPNIGFGVAGKGYSAFGDGGSYARHFWLTVQSNTMDASFLFGTNSKYGPPALTISNASRTVNVTNLVMLGPPAFQKTNAAPSNVTIGTTVPDLWITITNNGNQYFMPVWKNH